MLRVPLPPRGLWLWPCGGGVGCIALLLSRSASRSQVANGVIGRLQGSPSNPLPVCQGEANAAIAQEETKLRQARQALWRRQFWLSATEVLGPGSRSLKTDRAADPDLASDSMLQAWEPVWTKRLPTADANWDEVCNYAGYPKQPTCDKTFEIVTADQFLGAIREGSGSAGFDGWTARELKSLASAAPVLFDELLSIFYACAREAQTCPASAVPLQFAWKVVGIPKRTEDALRPIAVASAAVRAYNRALLQQFPPAPSTCLAISGPRPDFASCRARLLRMLLSPALGYTGR